MGNWARKLFCTYLFINCCLEIPGCADSPDVFSSINSWFDPSTNSDDIVVGDLRLCSSCLGKISPLNEGGNDNWVVRLTMDCGRGDDGKVVGVAEVIWYCC